MVSSQPPFLAMAELMQASFCSFGLTKTFFYCYMLNSYLVKEQLLIVKDSILGCLAEDVGPRGKQVVV